MLVWIRFFYEIYVDVLLVLGDASTGGAGLNHGYGCLALLFILGDGK